MWEMYDRIIEQVPDDIFIDRVHAGDTWTVVNAGDFCGVAVTVNEQGRPLEDYNSRLRGRSLREVAALCRSWNFTDASVGTAAANAYLNSEEHLKELRCTTTDNAFEDYGKKTAGKKSAVIGHFYNLERFLSESQVHILERKPLEGDYPDPACEYILPEMDYVFITGSAFINKTLPRLLEISPYPVVLGPSTPLSPVLFDFGAKELSGLSPFFYSEEEARIIGSGDVRLKDHGRRVRIIP